MTDSGVPTARQHRQALLDGDISLEAALEQWLDIISEREPEVQAWCHLDPDSARRQARQLAARGERGPLYGLPFGIKDIIDTADMPTGYGLSAYAGHRPAADASCVALLRRAGAIIPGKTVTTELAYFAPGKTRNPRNPSHTPGGSSSGSAAAVAAGMLPLSYGTQTGGSVIRPAAFCGVVGYKASRGGLPLQGVKTFCHTLDSLGAFAIDVSDMHLVRAALLGAPDTAPAIDTPPYIGIARTREWDQADPAMRQAVEAAAANCERQGATVVDVELPEPFERLVESQRVVMAYEGAQNYCFEYDNHSDALHPHTRTLIEEGRRTSFGDYTAALRTREQGRAVLSHEFGEVDVLLHPSAPGEAPAGLESTGDALFNRVWTLLGVPCVNLPGHVGTSGLPLGVQAIGPVDADEMLLRICQWLEPRIA